VQAACWVKKTTGEGGVSSESPTLVAQPAVESVLVLPLDSALTPGLRVTPASRSHPNLATRTRPCATPMRRVGAVSRRKTRQPPIKPRLSSATVATRLPPRPVVCRPHPVASPSTLRASHPSPARTASQPTPLCAGPRPSFPV
jgi:hypothetical protein